LLASDYGISVLPASITQELNPLPMKPLITALFFLAGIYATAQEADQEVKSKISQVTVFLEGAQITRQAPVALRSGVTILKFSGVSPNVLEQSIQAEATAQVKILSVSFQVNHLDEQKSTEKASALKAEKKKFELLLAQERSREQVFVEEESILKTNKSIGGTTEGVRIEELKVAMDYFRQRLIEIKQQQFVIAQNIEKYSIEIEKINAQMRELNIVKPKPTGEIFVKVSLKSAAQSDMKITYLVNEARWFPSYDIRARNIKSPVAITYKTNVSQHSGEDWDDVTLTVSSANPTQVGARPVVKSWILGFNNYADKNQPIRIRGVASMSSVSYAGNQVRGRITDDMGEGIPGVNVLIKGSTVGTVSDANGDYYLPLTADAETLVFSFVGYSTQEVAVNGGGIRDVMLNADVHQLQEVVTTGYGSSSVEDALFGRTAGVAATPRVKKVIAATPVVRQTDIEFTIDEPFTVKSDGEVRTTEMVEYELDALYEYYCAPKLDNDAFLVAKVLDWDEYNFLDGEASLFFEGKYIGKSVMDTKNTSDTLTLSLGRDANVLVTREKVKDLSSRQLIGSNQKAVYAYDVIVRNKKSLPVTIVVEDQIPVPNTKDIDVEKIEDSDGDYKEATGIIKWKKIIDPGKTETIKLKYAIKFPKEQQIVLE
jgi:hypothetical protein